MSHELKLTRTLSLTPEECFALWQNPQILAAWWGPYDDQGEPFISKIENWDLKEGADWAITMTAPSGKLYHQSGTILKVNAPHGLTFTFRWTKQGETGPTTKIDVRFDAAANGTEMTFKHMDFDLAEDRDAHISGWSSCIDRLEHFIGTHQEAKNG